MSVMLLRNARSRRRPPAAATAYLSQALLDSPVLLLPLNDLSTGLTDLSGHGHTATVVGAPTVGAFLDGRGSIVVNGVDQYLSIPDHPSFSSAATGQLTVELWYSPAVLTFADTEGGTSGADYIHFAGKAASGQNEWKMRQYQLAPPTDPTRQNRTSFYAYSLSGGLGAGSFRQAAVPQNGWRHVVGVINTLDQVSVGPTGHVRIYVDGVLRDSDSLLEDAPTPRWDVGPTDGTAPIRLGTADGASFLQGRLGYFAVYPTELSAARILAHYQAAVGALTHPAEYVGVVGMAADSAAGTVSSITVPHLGVPVGDTLVMGIMTDYTAGAHAVTDARGNTWVIDRSGQNNPTSRVSIARCTVTTALQEGDTITLTTSASTTRRTIGCVRYTGLLTSGVVDVVNSTGGTSSSPSSVVTSTVANDVAVSVFGFATADAGLTITPDSSWQTALRIGTLDGGGTADRTITIAHRKLGAATGYSRTATLGASATWLSAVAAYRTQ